MGGLNHLPSCSYQNWREDGTDTLCKNRLYPHFFLQIFWNKYIFFMKCTILQNNNAHSHFLHSGNDILGVVTFTLVFIKTRSFPRSHIVTAVQKRATVESGR